MHGNQILHLQNSILFSLIHIEKHNSSSTLSNSNQTYEIIGQAIYRVKLLEELIQNKN